MAQPERLIVGLGNPGPEYALTRHNIGFMAVDALASAVHAASWQRKFKGQTAQASVSRENHPPLAGGSKMRSIFGGGPTRTILLLKPMTFMNLSGEAVGEAMRYYKLTPADVIVFHDDIDLLPGKVKVKQGGGNAGHNGLKSIDEHIGPDFWRVRLGVGHPGNKDQVYDYVLHPFAKSDGEWLTSLLNALTDHFPLILEGNTEKFIQQLKA